MTQNDEKLVAHYRLFREYVVHEDDLIHQRSTWHHTIQGLLFAALGVTISKTITPTDGGGDAAIKSAFILLMPLLGIAISTAAFLSIRAATESLRELCKQWEEARSIYGDGQSPFLPQLTGAGNAWAKHWGVSPAYAIPIIIALAWVALLVIGLAHTTIASAILNCIQT